MYDRIILHILSAILKGIVMLVTNSESNGENKRKYIEYPDTNFEKVADDIVTEFNYVLSSWKSWAHE